MIVPFLTWWLAGLFALLSSIAGALPSFAGRAVVVEVTPQGETTAFLRRGGRRKRLSPGAAQRLGKRLAVMLHPDAGDVLTRSHTVPAVSRQDVQSILSYEISRITPFAPEELLWCWEAAPRAQDAGRLAVTLTMIPRIKLAPAIAALTRAGIVLDFVELERRAEPLLLPMRSRRPERRLAVAALGVVCAGLAVVAAGLPVLLQSLALARTEAAIAALQPDLREVEALRRAEAAYRAGETLLDDESRRVGDPLSILAAVSNALPNDCYLTNLALEGRHLTLSGRSTSAAHLITVLAAAPAIHDPAFAAPVLRGDGPSGDVFLIKASAEP